MHSTIHKLKVYIPDVISNFPQQIIVMKKIFAFTFLAAALFTTVASNAQQDKSKRASPPDSISQKISSGATIFINYSQPSLKGRTVGKDVEPVKDSVWRMGANEATVFEADKDVMIEGQKLPAGKYSLFGLWTDKGYTLIFNKAYKIWGTMYKDNKDKDALRVTVKPQFEDKIQEKLKYTIDKSGLVSLLWGNLVIAFHVK